jgi:hypothetical protein
MYQAVSFEGGMDNIAKELNSWFEKNANIEIIKIAVCPDNMALGQKVLLIYKISA